jgi:hypothetical protein
MTFDFHMEELLQNISGVIALVSALIIGTTAFFMIVRLSKWIGSGYVSNGKEYVYDEDTQSWNKKSDYE